MSKKKKLSKRDIPYCPDTENYILVKTKERIFWRRKRGIGKVNASFATNVNRSKICGPASSQIVRTLKPFMKGIDTGRITLRFSNALRKVLKEKKYLTLSALEGEEMQRDYPLNGLLLVPYRIIEESSECKIQIEASRNCVKKQNRIVTHFYFEGIIIYGDAGKENGLIINSVESKLYAFGEEPNEVCELCLPLPEGDEPWMILLKVSCLEGNEMAAHPKHYGMKVVKVRV
jgi:hypothetical protein